MKNIIYFVSGFCLAVFMFYSGFGVQPVLWWDWSLGDIHKNCLYLRVKKDSHGSSYKKIICVKNSWKY